MTTNHNIVTTFVAVLLGMALTGSAPERTEGDLTTRIDGHIQAWHETGRFNGVALVAVSDSVVFAGGYGLSDREAGLSHNPETRFDIRSIAKQFTCVLILQLAAQGRLKLDDLLSAHLPDYRPDTARRVTLDQLLRHTSGIPCFLNDSHRRPAGRPVFDMTAVYSTDEFITEFLSEDLLFTPGERYSYGNTAYYLLARVAERVTGRSFAQLVTERLLVPAGMKNSGVLYGADDAGKIATGYVRSPWGYRVCDPWRPEYLIGAGAMYSTAGDLFRWSKALNAGRFLSPEWMRLLREPYSDGPPPRHAYAMDHFTLRRRGAASLPYTGFSGGGQGYSSDVMRFGDGEVTVVLLDNTSQYNHWRIGPEIVDIVQGRTPRAPRPLLSDRLLTKTREDGWQAALTWYKTLPPGDGAFDRDLLESDLNTMGYAALATDSHLAVEVLRLNAAIFPDSWNAHDSLGEGLAVRGLTEESQASYATAKALQERTRRLRTALDEQQWNLALEIVRAARAGHPESHPLPDRMVGPLFEQALAAGDLDRAASLCAVWREAAPEAVGPLFSLSRVYRQQNNDQGRAECYRQILKLQPDNENARAALDELE